MLTARRNRWAAVMMAFLALLHAAASARAVEFRWTCDDDGNWTDVGCWSVNGDQAASAPTNAPNAHIVIGGTIPDADVTVTLGGGATVGSLTMEPGNTLHKHRATFDTARLTVLNDITNDGSIVLSSVRRPAGTGGAAVASLVTTDGLLLNSTTGLLHFLTSGGSGTVGGQQTFTGDLLNEGTVLAAGSTTFEKTGGEYVNHSQFTVNGTLRIREGGMVAQEAGTLTVSGSLELQDASTLKLTGGVVEMAGNLALNSGSNFTQQGGTLEHTSGTISNGTFNYLGGTITGTPQLQNATLNIGPAATDSASFLLTGNNTLASDLHAGQTLTVQNSVAGTRGLTSATGFTNSGTIALTAPRRQSGTGTAIASLTITDGALVNESSGLLEFRTEGGSGTIFGRGHFTGDMVNHGTVLVNSNTTFDKPNALYVNHGIIDAGGWDLTITNPSKLINHGLLRGRATLRGLVVNEGRLEGLGSSATHLMQINGWLTGPGELEDVHIAGTHAPGASAPELEGVYTLTSTATMIADIGGPTPGAEYTQLDATGTVNLGGQLQVRSIDASGGIYIPALGEQFTIFTSTDPINGTFANTTATSIASGTRIDWDILHLTNQVVLEAAALTPLLPGDYNGNGVVDAADYTVWRDLLGSNILAADGNIDGVIDGDDHDVWRANFGATAGSSATIGFSSQPVPEPTALALLLLAATAVAAIDRRRSWPASIPRT